MPTYHGSTLTLGTTAISLNVVEATPPAEAVTDIPLPHLGLAKGSVIPKEAGELYDVERWSFVLADDLNTQIVDQDDATAGATRKKVGRKVQTCTITLPIPTGLTNGQTEAFSGYVSKWQRQPLKTGERALINVEISVGGNITKTAAS